MKNRLSKTQITSLTKKIDKQRRFTFEKAKKGWRHRFYYSPYDVYACPFTGEFLERLLSATDIPQWGEDGCPDRIPADKLKAMNLVFDRMTGFFWPAQVLKASSKSPRTSKALSSIDKYVIAEDLFLSLVNC